jgi:hypothetical protein
MTAEHEEKVRNCLDLLQEAQSLVNQAAQQLCSVPGTADEWSDLSEPIDCIKKHWYKIESRRQALRRVSP